MKLLSRKHVVLFVKTRDDSKDEPMSPVDGAEGHGGLVLGPET